MRNCTDTTMMTQWHDYDDTVTWLRRRAMLLHRRKIVEVLEIEWNHKFLEGVSHQCLWKFAYHSISGWKTRICNKMRHQSLPVLWILFFAFFSRTAASWRLPLRQQTVCAQENLGVSGRATKLWVGESCTERGESRAFPSVFQQLPTMCQFLSFYLHFPSTKGCSEMSVLYYL